MFCDPKYLYLIGNWYEAVRTRNTARWHGVTNPDGTQRMWCIKITAAYSDHIWDHKSRDADGNISQGTTLIGAMINYSRKFHPAEEGEFIGEEVPQHMERSISIPVTHILTPTTKNDIIEYRQLTDESEIAMLELMLL